MGVVALGPGRLRDAVEDPPLPLVEDSAIALLAFLGVAFGGLSRLRFRGFLGIVAVTRKPPLTWNSEDVFLTSIIPESPGVFELFLGILTRGSRIYHAWLRASLDAHTPETANAIGTGILI